VIAPSLRQRRKDTETRQQVDILKSLVDNAGYGLGRYCLTRKRLVYFNQHMMDLIGCLDEVMPGLPAMGKQHCDYIQHCFANTAEWQEFVDAAESQRTFQKIILWRSQSGALRYMRMHGVPTESPDGIQVDLSVEDATDAVRHEQQFRQSQKMEALGRMAGGVAHDFNNLLLVILGHAELLDEALPKDSDMRRHTTKLITASRQAADITGTLVTFSRGEEPLLGLLPLNKAIREYAHLLPSFLRAGVMLDLDLAEGEFHILANSTHVEQVVLNLCVNARDAMPDGGRVTVRTKYVPGGDGDKGSVMLEVSDNGVGMDAETRAHIFEPFYTTKARGKGTGLGLALVYGIVTQYGGRIEVDTEVGRGTAFRIFFPLGEKVRDTASVARTLSPPPKPSTRKTVLLVDDQPEIRMMVGEFLKMLGHEVICAEDGRAALAIASSHAANIDLLLSDVMMPHMDGFELATRIREEHPGIAVLLMSGYTGGALAKRGKDLGDVPFLPKPFSMRQLQTSLETLLESAEPLPSPAERQMAMSGVSPRMI
jgi:signal transduction histidine kinase/ActR/RegA family two-component response regulator